jgi:hypothetical protein
MGIFSSFKNIFKKLKKTPPEADLEQKQQKKKLLDFIENNTSKNEFIHWVLNNNGEIAFSEEDSWQIIKKEIFENVHISVADLRAYSVTLKDEQAREEALEKVVERTEEATDVAKELAALGHFKKISIAIGGALFLLGILRLTLIALILLGIISPELAISATIINAGLFTFMLISLLEIFGGIFLVIL